MPARPWRIPLPPTRLNHFDSPTSPSSLPTTSPRSPNNIPPPRLHLRTIIASPPLPAEYLKTAPTRPYPWIWRCHLCGSIYRLGTTRRCLEDGHYFCSFPSPPASPVIPSSEDFFSSLHDTDRSSKFKSGKQIIADLQESKKRAKSRRKNGTRGCRSEFDYAGWAKHNIWRREIAMLKSGQKRKLLVPGLPRGGRIEKFEKQQMKEGATRERSWKARNCWKDCDFPSECHNERKAEREWERQMREIMESEERWARENSWDDEVEMSDEAPSDGILQSIEEAVLEQVVPEDVYEELIIGRMENQGPLGTDSDGLGEQIIQADYVPKRRKSLDAAMDSDSPPISPLTQECSFGFEDPATGCQIWSGTGLCSCKGEEEDMKSTGDDGDIEMKEVAMAKSPFLRALEKDVTDEGFGDEVMGGS